MNERKYSTESWSEAEENLDKKYEISDDSRSLENQHAKDQIKNNRTSKKAITLVPSSFSDSVLRKRTVNNVCLEERGINIDLIGQRHKKSSWSDGRSSYRSVQGGGKVNLSREESGKCLHVSVPTGQEDDVDSDFDHEMESTLMHHVVSDKVFEEKESTKSPERFLSDSGIELNLKHDIPKSLSESSVQLTKKRSRHRPRSASAVSGYTIKGRNVEFLSDAELSGSVPKLSERTLQTMIYMQYLSNKEKICDGGPETEMISIGKMKVNDENNNTVFGVTDTFQEECVIKDESTCDKTMDIPSELKVCGFI